jgi:hypothetical protein
MLSVAVIRGYIGDVWWTFILDNLCPHPCGTWCCVSSGGLFIDVRIEGQLWLIFATGRREKGNDGRKATVRVQIPKSKDIET